ncbi:hypothetical protein OESDEN_18739, partial [Oesophagostomum dentatum]
RSQAVATKRRERRHGLSELHYTLAKAYQKHGHYVNARNHMLFAERPEEFAGLLQKMCEESGCKSSESDLFCVMSVLQLLAMHRVHTASKLLTAYTAPPSDTSSPFKISHKELLNFLRLLCNALTLRDVNLFDHLVEVYQPHLEVDPTYRNYIDRIGHIFFGHPTSKKGDSFGGVFGSILKVVSDKFEAFLEKREEETFSDSDFEPGVTYTVRAETEESYETAEESDMPDAPCSDGPKRVAVESFDDLD